MCSVCGSPWSITSRPAISVSHVSPTTIDGAKSESSTMPTSETSRIGKGLVSRMRRSALRGDAVGRRSAHVVLGAAGVRLKSDTGRAAWRRRAVRVPRSRHRSMIARAAERLSGPWARVGRDPRGMARPAPHDDPSSVTVVPDSAVVRAAAPAALPDVPGHPPQPLARRSRLRSGSRSRSSSSFFAIRGADLGAVWSTLAGRRAAAAARRGGVHGSRLLAPGGPLAADRRHAARRSGASSRWSSRAWR